MHCFCTKFFFLSISYLLKDQKMDNLKLPWDDEYWNLIITCTISTAEVWGRIIGKDHSVSYFYSLENVIDSSRNHHPVLRHLIFLYLLVRK